MRELELGLTLLVFEALLADFMLALLAVDDLLEFDIGELVDRAFKGHSLDLVGACTPEPSVCLHFYRAEWVCILNQVALDQSEVVDILHI